MSRAKYESIRRMTEGIGKPVAPAGPCVHRGSVVREAPCRACAGSVRRKVYACAKHGEVTMMDCGRCEDFNRPEE